MDEEEGFDLQGQLDQQDGYSQDYQDNSQSGADYLQNQSDWNFGNYQDQMSQYDNMGSWQQAGQGQQGGMSDVFMGGNGQAQGYLTPQGGYQDYNSLGMQSPMNSTSDFLSKLFSGGAGSKGMLTGLGAVLEGMQNKKKASSVQNIVNQQQQRLDPFGSQRGQYQQELSRTMQDPYSAPIVRNQVQQMQQAQAIKDAQAGRRSNQATSNPALMAAQAQVAQKYMDSLYQPAGANISPNSSGLSELMQGNNAGINGYASPIMSALGYNSSSNQNSAQMQAIVDALAKFKAGG